jgi:hypothetical protein
MWVSMGRNDPENGWVVAKAEIISHPDNVSLYIAAIYWVMTTCTTVGYGDFSGSTNEELLFQMLTQFLGIGFFGYIIGNISSMIGQVDSISELQEEEEERQNIWLMKLGRAYKDKILSSHYYDHISTFYASYWNMDYNKLKENEFYDQLKPKLKLEVDNLCFQIYERFSGFFDGLENGFKREIVHNLFFEEFRIFPPYTDTYKDDKRSFPDRQQALLLPKGKVPERLFFIVGGEAYASNTTGCYSYFILPAGAYFGETHVLSGLPLSYNIYYDEQL